MGFVEGRRMSDEEWRASYENDLREGLSDLHRELDESWFEPPILSGGLSISEYIGGNVLHGYFRMPLRFEVWAEVSKAGFDALSPFAKIRTQGLPRVRSEVVSGTERYIARITPPVSAQESEVFSEYTTLQFVTDYAEDGFVIEEVPHPDLPDKLKKPYKRVVISPFDLLNFSVEPVTFQRRNEFTFLSREEKRDLLYKNAMETFRSLQKLSEIADTKWMSDYIEGMLTEYADINEQDMGEYPPTEDCYIDEDLYYYLEDLRMSGTPYPEEVVRRLEGIDEAYRRRVAIELKIANQIRNAVNN